MLVSLHFLLQRVCQITMLGPMLGPLSDVCPYPSHRSQEKNTPQSLKETTSWPHQSLHFISCCKCLAADHVGSAVCWMSSHAVVPAQLESEFSSWFLELCRFFFQFCRSFCMMKMESILEFCVHYMGFRNKAHCFLETTNPVWHRWETETHTDGISLWYTRKPVPSWLTPGTWCGGPRWPVTRGNLHR